MTDKRTDEEDGGALKNPWVWAIAGIIGSGVAANFAMAFIAVATNPGLVVEDYYERGKSYASRSRLEMAKDGRPGWKLAFFAPERVTMGKPARFTLKAPLDGDGMTVSGAAVVYAYRPSDASMDFSAAMEMTADGVMAADISFPLKGEWDLIAEFSSGGARESAAKRIRVDE
ncbi:MAG: FixH family protein [Candidatus Nitrospinota bacterium M3_3B_026]